MAHDVTFILPERPLGNSDIDVQVKRDGVMFGTLKISKGAVVWLPANGKFERLLTWDKLDQLAEQYGTAVR
ncbi:MAG TPA: hypothetical protein VFA29_15975 [Candidatus Baltobacteraceae bacterium]|nr:hypothetical protein [Candidatus Baltobacteraceae bacterium]